MSDRGNDGRVVVMAEEGGDDVKWRKRWQSSGIVVIMAEEGDDVRSRK